ncbi:ArnT family glycosyltransferase [Puia sp. P3]|uniref:ArnT family glycosyltransferase n=1 Tax=Puia sp. P3 TaxID=3423952 RepID=UPI003D677C33
MNQAHSLPKDPLDPARSKKALTILLVAGFLIRVAFVFFVPLIHMHRDSFEYYRQAEILREGRYLNYFPNGYPLMVFIAKQITANHSQTLLLWLNIFMSTTTIWFVYDIALRTLKNRTVALTAGIIFAIFPPLLNYVRWIMSEGPTFFFLLGSYYYYFRQKNWLSGLFFGLTTLVRTNIAPVFLLIVAIELVWKRRLNYRLLITAFIPIILLGSYCYLQTGKFSIEGNARINILYSVTAKGNYIDFEIGDKYPQIDTEDKAVQLYMDHMKKEPGEFLSQRIANLWELWGFVASDAQGFRSPATRLMLGLCNFFLVVFGIVGFWLNRRSFDAWLLILPFVVLTGIHTILVAIPRYAYPAHPFMIIFGSWTIWWLLSLKKKAPAAKAEALERQ